MRPLRVLFGGLPATLLTFLSEALGSRTDVEVVGVAERPTSLLVEAGTLQADIVVVTWASREPPGITSHLLDQYPHIRVVAVTPDGRQALVSTMRPHAEHVAVRSPTDLIRALLRLPEGRPED
jgi:DNA-binding NarL/FixJ family response regulator